MIGVISWKKLPNQMPVHWGFSGEPDGYSSRAFAVFFLPLFLLIVHLFCALVISADPKRQNISDKMFQLVLWICPAISFYVAFLAYRTVFSLDMNVERISLIFLSVAYIALGNYLPKCRQNYTVGIKLPWTLNDEKNWNQTHHFAGWVWMVGGILLILNSFIGSSETWKIVVVCVISAFLGLLPIGYSFIFYLKHKK